MKMKLYKDDLPEFDGSFKKVAGFVSRLSETPENWPQELTSDIFKQLPYLSDYDVNINLDRVEPQRGFAFGYADVHNRTERPEQEHDEAGLPHIRIPIVVQERAVKPFSVFLDGEKVLPLNEDRVREQLFSPQAFDLSVSAPQDPSLVEPLMPPHRSGIGMGGDYKMASADEKLLAELQGLNKTAISRDMVERGTQSGIMTRIEKGTADTLKPKVMKNLTRGADLANERMSQNRVRAGVLLNRAVKATEGVSKAASINKEAFKHISKEQWDAMYNSLEVQKLMHEYNNDRAHPAIQNKVYEMATKMYGYHPKPEPPAPAKLQEFQQKLHEKKQKAVQKQSDKAKKMVSEGQKLMNSTKPKTASLLMAIAPTIREQDAEAFINKIAGDANLQAGLSRSGILPTLIEAIDNTKRASANDRLQAISDNIAPTVVTIQKLPGGDFLVKSANNEAFQPNQEAQGEVVPQQEMAQNGIGQEQAQAMLPGQTATAVSDPAQPQEATPPSAESITSFGEYLVQDLMGNQVMGWVFPTTLAWDGNFSEQPVALFTNGSAFAIQNGIAGEIVGKSPVLPMQEPRGEGFFYEVTREGARATAPVTVKGGMTGPEGTPKYMCTDMMGNQFSVSMAEGLSQPQRVSDADYAIPPSWKFAALNNQTQLVPDADQMNKAGAVKLAQSSVTLFWNGSFNLEGGCGLEKVGAEFRYDLDPVSAEFMLGLLGVPGADAKQKIAQARKSGSVKIAGLKTITLLGERYEMASKTASGLAARIPNLQRDLVKEAAALEDENTVDKILALNFINPENLSTFVEYLPELEQTSEHMAEMLLSGYLGMKELPESSIEKAMKGMEEVVLQLRAVQHAEG
jgi:hypothetical protein